MWEWLVYEASVVEVWLLTLGAIVGMYAVAWMVVGILMLCVLVWEKVRG